MIKTVFCCIWYLSPSRPPGEAVFIGYYKSSKATYCQASLHKNLSLFFIAPKTCFKNVFDFRVAYKCSQNRQDVRLFKNKRNLALRCGTCGEKYTDATEENIADRLSVQFTPRQVNLKREKKKFFMSKRTKLYIWREHIDTNKKCEAGFVTLFV